MGFLFDPAKIKEAESNYSKLKLTPYQKGVVYESAKVLSEKLNMSELAARGFIGFAIKDWQQEDKILAEEHYRLDPQGQRDALKRMHVLFYRRVSRIVPENQRKKLEDTLMETYKLMLAAYKLI